MVGGWVLTALKTFAQYALFVSVTILTLVVSIFVLIQALTNPEYTTQHVFRDGLSIVVLSIGSWMGYAAIRRGDSESTLPWETHSRSAGDRRHDAVEQSRRRHKQRQRQPPPVDIGDVERAVVQEFSPHHSRERDDAVCQVEGFYMFVKKVPQDVEVGDTIRFTVASFNRGGTSATALFHSRA